VKCLHHPTIDAIGVCSDCGIAYCDECVETNREVAERLRAELRRIRLSKLFFLVPAALGIPIGFYIFMASLQGHRSLLFLAMALGTALFGSLFPPAAVVTGVYLKGSVPVLAIVAPFAAVVAGYVSWACFWGIPAVWTRWWGGSKRSFVIGDPITWLVLTVMFIELPLFVGYGIFGGGVYEYVKCYRVTHTLPVEHK
jgi:hypothetical protein